MRRIVLILYLLSVFITAGALDVKNITVKNISTEHGLSHHSVNTIYQDEFGFMWIGTMDGLNRYDGHHFKVFKPDDTIPYAIYENNIRHVCGDGKGHLYIKGLNSLSEFDMRTQRFRLLAKDGVKVIFHDGKRLWVSDTGTISVYDPDADTFSTVFSFADKGIYDAVISNLIVGKDGRRYVATSDDDFYVVSEKGNIIKHLNVEGVSYMLEDSVGNIWIATFADGVRVLMKDGSIREFLHGGTQQESATYNNVRSLCEDKSGNIWMSTYGGLVKIDSKTGRMIHYRYEFVHEAFNVRSISPMFYDSQGSLWLGSFHNGISIYNPDAEIYSYYKAKRDMDGRLNSPVISSIVEDNDGRLIIGTEGGWINVLDRKTGVFRHPEVPEPFYDKTVKSLLYNSHEDMLYAANLFGGITTIDMRTGRSRLYLGEALLSNVVAMKEYGRDSIFLASRWGIKVFDKRNGNISVFDSGFKSNYMRQVWDMEFDDDGNIWFTTSSELYSYNIRNNITRCYALGDLVPGSVNNHFNHILKDKKNRLWFGSSGSGFFLYEKSSDTFRRFGVNEGMPSGFVTEICEDPVSGTIYVATNKGLVSYEPDEGILKSYCVSNNFPITFIRNMFITHDRELFVCDLDGMISVSCEDLKGHPRDYDVFVSGLMVDNEPCAPEPESSRAVLDEEIIFQKDITLSPRHSSVSFEITSTDYLNISDFAVEYKLEGFDTDFIRTSGQYQITYTNLSPGRYRFVVRGLSPDSRGEYPGSEVSLTVVKPFYLTWWFFLLVFLVVGAIVFYLFRVYAMSVRLRSLNSVNESKMRFFTNISHEFRTPLTLINGQLEILLQQGSLKPSVYSRILSIYRNASTMNSLVNEIMDMMKSEAGRLTLKVSRRDIVAFLKEIYVTFDEYARQRDVTLSFECEEENCFVEFDARQMEKVFFNLLSNAFKYTPAGGGHKDYCRKGLRRSVGKREGQWHGDKSGAYQACL